MSKGKKFYEHRLKGFSNAAIAKKFDEKPYVVSARISEYRRQHKLPEAPKQPFKNYYKELNKTRQEQRIENLAKAKRRKDGVIQCPTKYCVGFGLEQGMFD